MKGNWKTLMIAALISALASIMVVSVGPGFSKPGDGSIDDAAAVEATSTDAVTDEAVAATTTTQLPHSDAGNSTASTTPDTHGHVGAGTGTSTGSQADPGHKVDRDGTDGATNGPGTGDTAATSCPNDESSVNGDTDSGSGGANTSGPYDSTCDGRISQNGQGDDAPGGGTPCAGCVGNADDKNPPGQVREFNGQKANDMGYECDGNQGVGAHYGNGNPAHTGDCATAPLVQNPQMTINVDCFGVTVTSTQDISNVKVFFVDGTSQEINVNSPSFSQTFTKQIQHATAKSALTVVSDTAPTNCTTPTPPTPVLTIDVTCTSVQASSTHNIDSLTVVFADGTSQTFTGLGQSFSQSYTKFLSSASATSGTQTVSDTAPSNCSGTSPTLTTNADCFSVHVTSSQNIESVVVTFVGGSTQTFTNVGTSFVRNFQTPISSVSATSGGVTNSDTAPTNCQTPPCVDDMNTVIDECNPPPQLTINVDCFGVTVASTQPITAVQVNFANGTSQTFTGLTGLTFSQNFSTPLSSAVATSGTTTASDTAPVNCGTPPPCVDDTTTPMDECNPPPLCPVGSDKEGQPMPGGDIRRCYNNTPPPTELCPIGTDLAGQPMPGGDIRNCNDDVLGGTIGRPPGPEGPGGPEVLGEPPAERPGTRGGRVVPFTGASIFAYLLLALELMGAGALLLRARSRKR